MENESNEIYAAFGLEAPAESEDAAAPVEATADPGSGPEEQKPEDTAADAAPGEPEQTEAEPETPETEPEAEPEAEPEVQPQPVEPDTSMQVASSIEDANYAAAFMGRKNPYTGKPILTKADFDEYVKAQEAASRADEQSAAEDELKKIGITPEQLEALMGKTKFGQEMRAALEYTRRQAADSHKKAIDDLIAKDIAEIAKYDPTVKDVDSLKKTAHGKEIEKRVASGRYTWKEAWMLENFDAMQSARTDAAKQAAMNAASSKDHLQSTAQRGSGEVDVPDSVAEMYKVMGITDKEEMRRSYASYLKDIKKG